MGDEAKKLRSELAEAEQHIDEECIAEVYAVLEKYGRELIPVITIKAGQIIPSLEIVRKQDG
jgi:hypothetical protein